MGTLFRRITGVCLAIATSVAAVGCYQDGSSSVTALPSGAGDTTQGNQQGCISQFDANRDYFPEKTQFSIASGIKVEYHKSYKVVTVDQTAPGASAERYVLVQCGAPEPTLEGDLAKAVKVQIPVKKIAASSTTQVPVHSIDCCCYSYQTPAEDLNSYLMLLDVRFLREGVVLLQHVILINQSY